MPSEAEIEAGLNELLNAKARTPREKVRAILSAASAVRSEGVASDDIVRELIGWPGDGQELRERAATLITSLREALEPFSDIDGEGDEDFPDDTQVTINFGRSTVYAVRLGHFRRARTALNPSRKETGI